MANYYIDHKNDDNSLDGLSPETAKRDYTDIELVAGDTVLFKRGSFYRDKLTQRQALATEPTARRASHLLRLI